MKKIPLIFLAYFDFDIIKRSLESFYEFSEFFEIIVVENKSINSPKIKSFLKNELKNKKIHSCYFFQRNLSNNSLEIIISRELKSLLINEYFFISDGDLVLEDKNTYVEIKNIMDKHQDLFACGVSLDKRNLPLNNFPESAKWIPDDISEEDDFFEARTGAHLLMLRSSDFFKYWKFRESGKESLTDSSMANYCYKFLGKRWARTKKSKALHLTWDSYNDINHPYTIEKFKKTFSQTWNHKDYFSLVEFNSNNGKKIFFIDFKRFIFGLFFSFRNAISRKLIGMKKLIKKILIKLLGPIITKIGYVKKVNKVEVNELNKNHLLYNFFSNIITMGFNPKHIVDIGANHGTWTREALKYFPEAHYTLLEPQKWLKPSFQDILDTNPKVQFYPVGAGEKEGSFQFTIVDRDDSCSFRYSEEEAKTAGFEQIEIPVITLNGLLADSELPIPDIIKIDAEGLDLEVLKGASNFFGKTEIFMVEAGVVNKIFDNSFLKLINFMDENGYRLFEITDINRPFQPKVLWLVELVFVKKNGYIDSQVIVK